MEDTIEVCSGCGKMPRPIDFLNNQFLCSRCGSSKTVFVNSDDYEKVVTDLDAKFHSKIIESRVAVIKKETSNPIGNPRKRKAKKAVRRIAKRAESAKKAKPKKKTIKKPKKKAVKKAARKAVKRKKAVKKAAKKKRKR